MTKPALTLPDRTPFYDFVRSQLRLFAGDGVLEVMHLVIGSGNGPVPMQDLQARLGATPDQITAALTTLIEAGFIVRDADTFVASTGGRALHPVLGPFFEWSLRRWNAR